jgi:hypothetical protein
MPSIKKPSKSNAFAKEKTNDLDKAKEAIQYGAKLVVETTGWGKESYGIRYSEGGYFGITKTVYNKLKALIK